MKLFQKNRNRLILCLLVWWIFVAVFYMNTAININLTRKTINQTGIKMAKVFSSRVSLPLLELDMPALSALLSEATSSADIVYAAIIDHKNNIIAYTSVELIMSAMNDEVYTIDQVSFWEDNLSDHKKNINFSSDVSYAETKIGEIYLTISAAEIDKFEKRFVFGAFLSFIILLFMIIVLFYKEVRSIFSNLKVAYRAKTSRKSIVLETTCIICPLCGTSQPFSHKVFNDISLNRFSIIRATNSELKIKASDKSKDIFLSEIATRKDLNWLKRQVIVRCLEIIKKLAD